MSKHTPGPWVVGGAPSLKIWGGSARRYVICEAWHAEEGDREANARLIAAAPDGKALAERVMECASECPLSVVEIARAFLAKAEGRS